MSAYALPGGIFPPISGGFVSSYSSNNSSSTGGSLTLADAKARPLESCGSPLQFKPVSFSSLASTLIAPDSPLTPCRPHQKEETKEPEHPVVKEVGISVTEAKIDPVRLVQSLTTKKSRKPPQQPALPPAPPLVIESRVQDEDDPHKEAIQFELVVSYNGRTYTATRTLPRIMQLRNDLISEINTRRKQLQRMRFVRDRKNNNCYKVADEDDDDDDDNTVETVEIDEWENLTIPELPDYREQGESGTSATGGLAGRGFTMLHALLGNYCPVMERWLRSVADLVPPTDSPSLSHFLWEPCDASTEASIEGAAALGNSRSNRSFSTLISIKEDYEWEDDEEDEQVIVHQVAEANEMSF